MLHFWLECGFLFLAFQSLLDHCMRDIAKVLHWFTVWCLDMFHMSAIEQLKAFPWNLIICPLFSRDCIWGNHLQQLRPSFKNCYKKKKTFLSSSAIILQALFGIMISMVVSESCRISFVWFCCCFCFLMMISTFTDQFKQCFACFPIYHSR